MNNCKTDISYKCYELLGILVNTYPESLEKEVFDYLYRCLSFYADNARYETELKKIQYIKENLQLEIF